MQHVIENCSKCGKKHNGVCYCESRACFKFGQMGHHIKDCPALKNESMVKPNDVNQWPKIQGQVFAVIGQSDEETKSGTISLFSLIKWNNGCWVYVSIVWLW